MPLTSVPVIHGPSRSKLDDWDVDWDQVLAGVDLGVVVSFGYFIVRHMSSYGGGGAAAVAPGHYILPLPFAAAITA